MFTLSKEQRLEAKLNAAKIKIEELEKEIEVRKATAKLVLDRVQIELIRLKENE